MKQVVKQSLRGLREIQEYITAEEKSEKLMDDIIGTVDEVNSLEIDRKESSEDISPVGIVEVNETQYLRTDKGVKMFIPCVRGVKVESFEQFRKIVEKDFLGLKNNKSFRNLMKYVNHHFQLYQKVKDNPKVSLAELRKFGRQIGASSKAFSRWITIGAIPKLYRHFEQALTHTEGVLKVKEIRTKLRGVENILEVERRLDSFYLKKELANQRSYSRHFRQIFFFYKFLDTLEEGGLHGDICKRVGINRATGRKWREGDEIPRLVRIACEIPPEETRLGYKWLPRKLGKGGSFVDFIEVPEKITGFEEILEVLQKLEPLDTMEMEQWRVRFGDVSQKDAFMYMLGIIVSYGYFSKTSTTLKTGLGLSKIYDWSEIVGEAFCYYQGLIGIHAKRGTDWSSKYEYLGQIRTTECCRWSSIYTPLHNWIKRSVLEFDNLQSKKPLDVKWILSAPLESRIAFIQGISDGDGYVASYERLGISTRSNGDYFKKLLDTVAIRSRADKFGVIICRRDSIIRTAEMPFFRYAHGRTRKLKILTDIIKAVGKNGYNKSVTLKEKSKIMELRQKGLSHYQIRYHLWTEYGIGRSISTIRRYCDDST